MKLLICCFHLSLVCARDPVKVVILVIVACLACVLRQHNWHTPRHTFVIPHFAQESDKDANDGQESDKGANDGQESDKDNTVGDGSDNDEKPNMDDKVDKDFSSDDSDSQESEAGCV